MFAPGKSSLIRLVLTVAMLSALAAAPALSVPVYIISFDDPLGASGVVAYDGAGGPLTSDPTVNASAVAIGLSQIRGDFVPTPGDMLCDACLLTFTSGPNISEGPNYVWGANLNEDAFVITGKIFDDEDPVVLAHGTIRAATFNRDTGLWTATIGGFDTKDPRILDFFDVPASGFSFVATEITAFGPEFTGGGGFTAEVTDSQVNNVTIPEPATSLLMLLGLAGIVARRLS